MLTSKQKSFLRGLAHKLDPVASIGSKGVTEAVLSEIERALRDHELVKIKIASDDQQEFQALCEEIFSHLETVDIVQSIGHMLILYRPTKKKKKDKIRLPRADSSAS
jgi:RNA-binding protein